MAVGKLNIDSMLLIVHSGMPIAPTIRQLMNKDIKQLYVRDKTPDKSNYIKECIVIYYIGDPKSPAKAAGLSDAEALKMAISQAGLPNDYIPDSLVISLIKQYYLENITEAGKVLENITASLHNIGLFLSRANDLINEKLNGQINITDITEIMPILNEVNKKSGELPAIIKKLGEAKENLLYEKETEVSRGGNQVLSSMDASDYQ